jgi:hypothetical protein
MTSSSEDDFRVISVQDMADQICELLYFGGTTLDESFELVPADRLPYLAEPLPDGRQPWAFRVVARGVGYEITVTRVPESVPATAGRQVKGQRS